MIPVRTLTMLSRCRTALAGIGSLAFLSLAAPTPGLADIDPATFPSHLRALEWREVGPFRGGRSAAVTGLPSDRNTYYFGATGGGGWETENGGTPRGNVSDGYFGGSTGAGAVSACVGM